MKEGYFADLGRCFRGPAAWTNWVVLGYGIVGSVFVVYLAIGLFDAASTRNQILYATGLIIACLVVLTTKLWFWSQMSRRWLAARLDEMDARK